MRKSSPAPKLIDSKEIYKGKSISLYTENWVYGEKKLKRDIIKHPGAVVILPQLEDKRLLLIYQFRNSIRDYIYEFPAGTLEVGESAYECAKREIQEETSMATGELIELGTLIPTPGFCDEIQHCFLAKKLQAVKSNTDEDELIEVVPFEVDEVKKMIDKNIIFDAKTIAIFMKAELRGLL